MDGDLLRVVDDEGGGARRRRPVHRPVRVQKEKGLIALDLSTYNLTCCLRRMETDVRATWKPPQRKEF